MTVRTRGAPAHPPRGCAGVVLFALLAAGACREPARDEPVVLILESDTVTLPAGVRLIEIEIETAAGGEFRPAAPAARAGDVVRFVSKDTRSHAIVFDAAPLAQPMRAFLEGSGQLRGPPLLSAEASWIVSLEGAPPGDYPFRCLTHGATGTLTVSGSR